MPPARPTLRCLQEDLGLLLPSVDKPLDEVNHPLVRKAVDQFGDPAGPRERIRSIDDRVFYKVKAQRWRGAVWIEDERPWLVAAGRREEGSQDDFYEALAIAARSARGRYNAGRASALTTSVYSGYLLPTIHDQDRYAAETGARWERQLAAAVFQLARASLLSGQEHTREVAGATLGILIRAAGYHETYVAVRIIGSVPDGLTFAILELMPGCDRDGWYPERSMPTRPSAPNEQVWSTLMDPQAAAKLLEDEG